VVFAFDVMHLKGVDLRAKPLQERRRRMVDLVSERPIPCMFIGDHFANGAALLGRCERFGLEGVVSKRRDAQPIVPNLVRRRPLPPDVLGLLRHYVRKSPADNTRRSYASQWGAFDRWCSIQGCRSLPAEPINVAAYLAQRAGDNAALATINVGLAAIAFAHKVSGLPFDRSHPDLGLVLAGIRRVHGRPTRQAEPLGASLLRKVLAALPSTPAGLRDGALLAVLYSAALRCSEATALDWMQAGSGRGWLAIAPKHVEIVLLSTKASAGAVERVLIPAYASPLALRAIKRWVCHAGIQPGEPLLRPLTRNGQVRRQRLHADSIGRIVQRVMLVHFLNDGVARNQALRQARLYRGHSGRVGFCVTATEASVPAQRADPGPAGSLHPGQERPIRGRWQHRRGKPQIPARVDGSLCCVGEAACGVKGILDARVA
jgi:hypothetical protein